MFGTIDVWDKKRRQGIIFTDSGGFPAHDDGDWKPGDLVQLDVTRVGVNLTRNTQKSPIQAENVPSVAAEAAAESFKQIDVAAYYPQHGNVIDGGKFE